MGNRSAKITPEEDEDEEQIAQQVFLELNQLQSMAMKKRALDQKVEQMKMLVQTALLEDKRQRALLRTQMAEEVEKANKAGEKAPERTLRILQDQMDLRSQAISTYVSNILQKIREEQKELESMSNDLVHMHLYCDDE